MGKPLDGSGRSAFALLVTLSVLLIIIALTGIMLGYLDKARRNSFQIKAMVEANLLFTDTRTFFQSIKKRDDLYEILYSTPIPLRTDDGRFDLLLRCEPRDSGININWLNDENDAKRYSRYKAASKVFDYIVQKYGIMDPDRLLAYLKGDGIPLIESRFLKKHGIISFSQFARLVAHYRFETDDASVERVPWKRFFSFIGKHDKHDKLVGKRLSSAVLAVLFDMDEATVRETLDYEGFDALLGMQTDEDIRRLFTTKGYIRAQCNVSFMYGDERYGFRFRDDEGKVSGFEVE